MENLSEGHSDCDCDCDGGKTKSTPSLGFRLRLEFDNNAFEKIEKLSNSSLSLKRRLGVDFVFPPSQSQSQQ